MCCLTETERRKVRSAYKAQIVPGCPECSSDIAFLLDIEPPILTYVCLRALKQDDPEGYRLVETLSEWTLVGSEYWLG